MGISFLAWTSSRWKSSPLIPGNLMSRTRQLATSGRLLFINSVADPNSSTCKPTDSTRRLMARRTEGSSSTTKTMEAGSPIYRTRQNELEQRTPGSWCPEDTIPRRGCIIANRASLMKPLRGTGLTTAPAPGVRCATPGFAIKPLRGNQTPPRGTNSKSALAASICERGG